MSKSELRDEQRLALIQQVSRRLEKLDDQRLAEVESRTRPAAAVLPGAKISRRDFLRDVLLYTGAGLAVGGAVAYGKDRLLPGQPAGPAAEQLAEGAIETVLVQAQQTGAELTALQQSLAAAEAALNELRPQLSAALTENAGLKNDLTATQGDLAAKQLEADGLRGQLAQAEARIGQFRRLIELFEDLEAIPLDSSVVSGLAAAAIGFGGALGAVPLVTQGLALARSLFDGFENQFPIFQAGLDWLKGRLDGLQEGMGAVEMAAAKAIDAFDPAASRLGELINYILDHLPFGIGRSLKATLAALDDLYRSLPDLILGANGQVVNVLDERFSGGEGGLGKTLLQPVRESAFAPAEQLAGQVETLHQTFIRDLHDPVVGALDRRTALRKDIQAYRAANQV